MVSIETVPVDCLCVPVDKLQLCVIEDGILSAAFDIFSLGGQ